MSHTYTVPQPTNWNKLFEQWKFPLYFSKPVLNHLNHFLDGMLAESSAGTLTAIHRHSWHDRDRRTLSHFLTHGKWDEAVLAHRVRITAFEQVRRHTKQVNDPIFLLLDDTVCEKTKPSSQASCSIEGAGFHHSHLRGKKVYGHAMIQAMLRTGNMVYPFAVSRYEPEGKSKIEPACDLIRQVPVSTEPTYALVDACDPSASLLQTTAKGQLGLERYQVRSKRAIDRYWILVLVAAMCCTYLGNDHLLQGMYAYREQKTQG